MSDPRKFFEPESEKFDIGLQPLVSIAISLKRIADALNETNEYGEGAAKAIGGNIARAMSGSWSP